MRVAFRNIVKGKIYWVVDETAPRGSEVFEYRFALDEEPLDHWHWAVYETRTEAIRHRDHYVGRTLYQAESLLSLVSP